MSSNLSKSIFSLAHDISFAVFRVARVVKYTKLRTALEDAAVDLVANLSETAVDKLLALVKLTASINEIHTLNAEVLERELNLISDMLQERNTTIIGDRVGNEEEPNLAESFTEIKTRIKDEKPSNIALRQSAILVFIRELVPTKPVVSSTEPEGLPNGLPREDERGCRMRDLLTKFPEVSERTLRNDLQDLNSEGLVERLGKGAYSSFRAVTPHIKGTFNNDVLRLSSEKRQG